MKCENGCGRVIDQHNMVLGSITQKRHKRLCIFCAEELNYCVSCGSIHFDSNAQMHFNTDCEDKLRGCAMCNRCFRHTRVYKARFGELLCADCADKANMCWICGSTGSNPKTQRHYNEYCFK